MLIVGIAIGLIVGALLSRLFFTRRGANKANSETVDVPVEPLPLVAEVHVAELNSVLNAIPLGVVVTDEQGSIVLDNHIAAGVGVLRHIDVLVDEAVERMIKKSRATASVVRETLELFGPPPRTLVIEAMPLEGSKSIAIIEDISERTRIDAVRTDFVANISHELKTPVGALSILADTIRDEDDLKVIHRLSSKMVKESNRMAKTIDDLLELSRIELDGSVVPEPVSIFSVVAESIDRMAYFAAQAGIGIVSQLPEDDCVVKGDRLQLVSAVSNLIDNAVKYSEKGDKVTVRVAPLEETVDVSVSDEGIGIPQSDIDRIFERFYRVDRARSRGTGGTGLGLSIVRHVMNNHGGSVNVTSQEGEGSTFVLTLLRPSGNTAVNNI
jgi:two-component system sensor histidine kinase SenX3